MSNSPYKVVTQDAHDRIFLMIYCDYAEPRNVESTQEYLFNNVYKRDGRNWDNSIAQYNATCGRDKHTIKLQHVGLREDGHIDTYKVNKPDGYYSSDRPTQYSHYSASTEVNDNPGYSTSYELLMIQTALLQEILASNYLWDKLDPTIIYDKNVTGVIDYIVVHFPETITKVLRLSDSAETLVRAWESSVRGSTKAVHFDSHGYIMAAWNPVPLIGFLQLSPNTVFHEYTHTSYALRANSPIIHGVKMIGSSKMLPDLYVEPGRPIYFPERYPPIGNACIMSSSQAVPILNSPLIDMMMASLTEENVTLIGGASGEVVVEHTLHEYLATRECLLIQSRRDRSHYYAIEYKHPHEFRPPDIPLFKFWELEGLHIQAIRLCPIENTPLGNFDGYPYGTMMIGARSTNDRWTMRMPSEYNNLMIAGDYPDPLPFDPAIVPAQANMVLCDCETFGGVTVEILSEGETGGVKHANLKITLAPENYEPSPVEILAPHIIPKSNVVSFFWFTDPRKLGLNLYGANTTIKEKVNGSFVDCEFIQSTYYYMLPPEHPLAGKHVKLAKHMGVSVWVPEGITKTYQITAQTNVGDILHQEEYEVTGARPDFSTPILIWTLDYSTIRDRSASIAIRESYYSGIKIYLYDADNQFIRTFDFPEKYTEDIISGYVTWGYYEIDGLAPDTEYKFNARYTLEGYEGTNTDRLSFRTLEAGSEPPVYDKPNIVDIQPQIETIKIKHDMVSGALHYSIVLSSGAYEPVIVTTHDYDYDAQGYYLLPGTPLHASETYTVSVTAAMLDGAGSVSDNVVTVTNHISNPSITEIRHITLNSAIMKIMAGGVITGERIRLRLSMSSDLSNPIQDFETDRHALTQTISGLNPDTEYHIGVNSLKRYDDGFIAYSRYTDVMAFRTLPVQRIGRTLPDIFKGRFPRII